MKSKLDKTYPGQTDLKWDLIRTSIDPSIQQLRDEDQTDCRYADIHHIDSNHNNNFNNIVLLPHGKHSTITKRINNLTRAEEDPRLESIRLTLEYIKENASKFVGMKHPNPKIGIMIVWRYYLSKPRTTIPLKDALAEIGKEVPADPFEQLSFFDENRKVELHMKDLFEMLNSAHELDEATKQPEVENELNKTNGNDATKKLKEGFDEVGTYTYRYIPKYLTEYDDHDVAMDEEEFDAAVKSGNFTPEMWLTSKAHITEEDGWYQVSFGGVDDDYVEFESVEECKEYVEDWIGYHRFEWVD